MRQRGFCLMPPRLPAQFARFLGVGAIGFAVDLAATILLAPVAGNGQGRIAAIILAVSATYWLNRRFTFGSANPRPLLEAGRYGLVSVAGASINFGIYWLVLALIGPSGAPPQAGPSLIFAVAAGSVAAIACNFTGSKLFAFAK